MAITAPPSSGKAPVTEKPDAQAAGREGGSVERPGFDLGGARDKEAVENAGNGPVEGGSRNPVPAGTEAAGKAGATGMSDGAQRSPGGTAGGSKPGEASQGTAGAVRPPQSTGPDQSFSQGNPDDAA